HHRQLVGGRVGGGEALGNTARALEDAVALGEELVRDEDGLGEQTAGVVTQVENQGCGALRDELVEVLDHLLVKALVPERAEVYVTDVLGQHGAVDVDDLDGCPLNL